MELPWGMNSRNDDRALILLIDDDPDIIKLIVNSLHNEGYRCTWAEDAQTGIAIAHKYRPSLILLDLNLPDQNGLEVCRELKKRLATNEIPVIFITGEERTDALVTACFEAGCHDFLPKPLNRVDLFARLRVVLRDEAIRENYRRLATCDPMTGLPNRRQFFQYTNEVLALSRQSGRECFLVLADINGLSRINEQHGYDLGDEVLLTFSRLMRRVASASCRIGRIGDDEFAIVLTETDVHQTLATADRLRTTFASICFDAMSTPKHFTVCIGVSRFDGREPEVTEDELVNRADASLFIARSLPHHPIRTYDSLTVDEREHASHRKTMARAKPRTPSQRSFLGVLDSLTDSTPPGLP
jgi:diguanylate cyclase (GGDEF)-like protein